MQAQFPVPPGFVITTRAYDAFVEANQLQQSIIEQASQVKADDAASYEAASVAIQALFTQGAIPDDLGQLITGAYQQLSESSVAVRSSATAEDLPDASFAGQQETHLNVQGEAALLAAVKKCWASLWTARAMAYRERQTIDPDSVSLAVVVQQMIRVWLLCV